MLHFVSRDSLPFEPRCLRSDGLAGCCGPSGSVGALWRFFGHRWGCCLPLVGPLRVCEPPPLSIPGRSSGFGPCPFQEESSAFIAGGTSRVNNLFSTARQPLQAFCKHKLTASQQNDWISNFAVSSLAARHGCHAKCAIRAQPLPVAALSFQPQVSPRSALATRTLNGVAPARSR